MLIMTKALLPSDYRGTSGGVSLSLLSDTNCLDSPVTASASVLIPPSVWIPDILPECTELGILSEGVSGAVC